MLAMTTWVSSGISPVKVLVYDVLGREIAVLEDTIRQAGTHEVIWNGLDTQGTSAASGVYLYRISADSNTLCGKMLLLR